MQTVDHVYIWCTVLFTVYSQLILRWQVNLAGPLPGDVSGKITFVVSGLLNPWIISGLVSTFFAGVSWMLAMTKFEVSYAYPFIGLNYVLVLGISVFVFQEALTFYKVIGNLLIIAGIIVVAKG